MRPKKKCLIGFIIISGFIISILVMYKNMSHNLNINEIIAVVNGENIYAYNIEILYAQADGEISYKDILNDLINERVVITKANELGIQFSQKDLDDAVQKYKRDYPSFYKKGASLYGKTEYNNGIRRQEIYNAVFSKVVNETVSTTIENDFYSFMVNQYNELSSLDSEEVIRQYHEEFNYYVFNAWTLNQRKNSNIKIISPEVAYHDAF